MAAREVADQRAEPGTLRLAGAKDDVLRRAIQQLIDERREEISSTAGADLDCVLLSRLLSQLESSKEDRIEQSERSFESAGLIWSDDKAEGGGSSTEAEASTEITSEEILNELKKVRRQNTITHWLLSVLIVVTAVWQLSEASFILNVKNKVQHPFGAVRGMIMGAFKGSSNRTNEKTSNASGFPHTDVAPLPSLKMPEIPNVVLKPFISK